jgi:charged multivesicular body protein 6
VLDREHAIAKAQLAIGQKDRALIALRRRKYQLSLLTKTEEQLETLEHLVRFFGYRFKRLSVRSGLYN